MVASLASLPSELLASILAHLPVASVLSFSATCRTHQTLAYRALHTLNLAVFPTRIQCNMALMSRRAQSWGDESISFSCSSNDEFSDMLHAGVSKTTDVSSSSSSTRRCSGLNPNPAQCLDRQVTAQNQLAAEILNKPALRDLRSLSLQMYDMRSAELASVIAINLARLRHLELRFSHGFVHDQCLPPSYWHDAPSGSPAWNALVGLGGENRDKLRLHGLVSLRIERAGLTSMQLRRFVQANPLLRSLHLENVTGVDQEFVQWLAERCERGESRLEHIGLENCAQLNMQRLEDFAWLAAVTESELRYLSLYRCRNVRHDILVRLIDEPDGGGEGEEGLFELDLLEVLIPPNGPARHFGVVEESALRPLSRRLQTGLGTGLEKIEVDPEYAP